MSTPFHIRLPALQAIVAAEEVDAFLGPDHTPSTVRIIDASADMIPVLERHATRQFAAPREEVVS